MAQVIVRNLNDRVVATLKRKAALHGRSLEQELRATLTEATRLTPAERVELARRIRAMTPTDVVQTDSAELIREAGSAMILVADASVACKWLIAEADSPLAEIWLARGDMLLAPDLIIPEICNIACTKLRRGQVTPDQAAMMVEDLPSFYDEIVPSMPLARSAFDIASALSHPAYDAFYLALAVSRGGRIVTADDRLLRRLSGTRWAALAVGIGDTMP